MFEIADKMYKLVEKTNQTRNGEPSIFLLDPLLTKMSLLCQVKEKEDEVREVLE